MEVSLQPGFVWLVCIAIIAMSIPAILNSITYHKNALKYRQQYQVEFDNFIARQQEESARYEALRAKYATRDDAAHERQSALILRAEQLIAKIEETLKSPTQR